MKNLYRKLTITTSATVAALATWLLVFHTMMFCWVALAASGLGVIGCVVLRSYKTRRFCQERRAAMESVESIYKLIAYYDAELPLSYHHRIRFQTAVNNADKVGQSMRNWICLMDAHFRSNCLPKKGLRMKDVPEMLSGVTAEIISAYRFIHHDEQGKAPAILADGWFDESSIFGESVRILQRPSGPGMPGKARRARRQRAFPPIAAVQQPARPSLKAVPADVSAALPSDLPAADLPAAVPANVRANVRAVASTTPDAAAPSAVDIGACKVVKVDFVARRLADA